MDIQTASALADQEKKRSAKEFYLFKRQLQRRAAARQREKTPGHLSDEEREKHAADAIAKLRDMLDLSLEEQVATQMACITQSALDCMVRASSGAGTLPQDARQSTRHAELLDQARMHDSGSRMLDALTRMRGNSAYSFTYNHVREPAQPTPHDKS